MNISFGISMVFFFLFKNPYLNPLPPSLLVVRNSLLPLLLSLQVVKKFLKTENQQWRRTRSEGGDLCDLFIQPIANEHLLPGVRGRRRRKEGVRGRREGREVWGGVSSLFFFDYFLYWWEHCEELVSIVEDYNNSQCSSRPRVLIQTSRRWKVTADNFHLIHINIHKQL